MRHLVLTSNVAEVAEWAGPLEPGPDPYLLALAMRPALPMDLGGLGLSTLLQDVPHAAFVSAARGGRAEFNFVGRPKAIRPLWNASQ